MKTDQELINSYIKYVSDKAYKESVLTYIFAGRSTFTVESKKLGKRYTYRVYKHTAKSTGKVAYRVYRLYGQDNNQDYRFIGLVDKSIGYNRPINIAEDLAMRTFDQFMEILLTDEPWPEKCVFYKSNRCAKCGKLLTTPESIKTGYGPTCSETIYNKIYIVSTEFNEKEIKPC